MVIRSRYALGAPEKGLQFAKPSLTQQQFKDECDLESLLASHNITGILGLAQRSPSEPLYADVSDVPDFHESQNHTARATEYFYSLPSNVRSQFGNSLSKFLSALADPSAREALVSLGVLKENADKAQDRPSGASPDSGKASGDDSGSASVAEPVKPTGDAQKSTETP